MKPIIFAIFLILVSVTGCKQKDKNVLFTDIWACPKGARLEIRKDGYPGEEKRFLALGCRARNGDRVGYHTAWKDYGIKEHEGEFINDEPYGEWSYYHDNGALHSRGFYRKGKREGIWSFWDDNGNFLYDKKYKNGSLVNEFHNQTQR